jgi:AraC-like DNA-binding protein
MYTISTMISGMSIGLALLLLVKLLFHIKLSNIAVWLSVICMSSLAYMLRPYAPDNFTIASALGQLIAPAIAIGLLGFAKSIFLETPRLSLLEWGITFLYMGLNFAAYLNHSLVTIVVEDQSLQYVILRVLPQILKILLILGAIYFTVKHIQTDLVEDRRQMRFVFVFSVGAYLIFFLTSELLFFFEFPDWLRITHDVLILCIWALVCFWLLNIKIQDIENLTGISDLDHEQDSIQSKLRNRMVSLATVDEPKDLSSADVIVMARIEKLMSEDFVYRKAGLTISSLAKLVNIQEHKLRRLINQQLGYRNFNSYLNHYRISEAKSILADSSRSEVSIFVVAMDVGFNSLAPFNKAFKSETGSSPSDYRKSNVGDSLQASTR